jgi:hypothetical protein
MSREENRMKNKIFELYKDKSLLEFLDYKKQNPKQEFVYVVQHPPANINIIGATDYGHLVLCLPHRGPESQMYFSSGPFVFQMRKSLKNFEDRDYILLTGDPAFIAISCAIVADTTSGQFKLLKWDRKESKYYPIEIDLYQKG